MIVAALAVINVFGVKEASRLNILLAVADFATQLLLVLLGGITGCIAGYALQFWSATIAYPLNIGGRPVHSWPAFIVPTFETTILFAAGTAVLGMLALNGLPEPYHPVFNVPQFARASKDRFFIVIEARDPKFDPDRTWSFLTSLGPRSVSEVDQ